MTNGHKCTWCGHTDNLQVAQAKGMRKGRVYWVCKSRKACNDRISSQIDNEMLALAKVGITALVDEATGYQKQRFQQSGRPLKEKFEEFQGQDTK